MSENDADREKQSKDALEELQKGFSAHNKGELDLAIRHYSKAIELDDEHISAITSRLAAYYEMGKYNECIADCIRAEEAWQELRAMVLSFKGLAYLELAKYSTDCDVAIEALDIAYKVHENEKQLEMLARARSTKVDFEKRERLGDQQRELGNKCYTQNRLEAVKHYTEAIKLNPHDAKAYCNRAFCYTSDGRLAEALKDTEKCLELDPTFVRGYLQKGNIEFEKKEYRKALETYEMGLKHDKENKELLGAIRECREQMLPAADKETVIESSEALKDKQAKAALDPEIQSILSDPIMRQVLIDFQQSSSDAQEHVKNKLVLEKLRKLFDVGLL